jgi:hypothetical protein
MEIMTKMKNKTQERLFSIITLLFIILVNIIIGYKIPKTDTFKLQTIELKDTDLSKMIDNINKLNFIKSKDSRDNEFYTYKIHLISEKSKNFSNFLGVDEKGENVTIKLISSDNKSYGDKKYKISIFEVESKYVLTKILVDNKDFTKINNEQLDNIKTEKVLRQKSFHIEKLLETIPIAVTVLLITVIIMIPITLIQIILARIALDKLDDWLFEEYKLERQINTEMDIVIFLNILSFFFTAFHIIGRLII